MKGPGAEEKVIKTFSLCFIELQQRSNKLEKFVFFFPNSLAFYLCNVLKWGEGGGVAHTIHIATFTPDMSLGFSSLKIRTNWKEKVHSRSLKLAQN